MCHIGTSLQKQISVWNESHKSVSSLRVPDCFHSSLRQSPSLIVPSSIQCLPTHATRTTGRLAGITYGHLSEQGCINCISAANTGALVPGEKVVRSGADGDQSNYLNTICVLHNCVSMQKVSHKSSSHLHKKP